jgi:hypothetical protein
MDRLNDTTDAFAKLEVKNNGVKIDTKSADTNSDATNSSTNEAETEPSTTNALCLKVITLNIGGRKFQTSTDTLRAESGLFRQQLSERFTWTPELDGSYFLDADGDLFEHLLRFMRRPEIFPLFYDTAKGFNYDLYNKLETEAEYFQIELLHEWIKAKKYTQAIKTKISSAAIHNIRNEIQLEAIRNPELHITPCTKKIYLCPRQIVAHRGRADLCGTACHKRQAENDVVYEDEPYWQVLSFEKEVVFDEKVCKAG